MAKRTTRGKPGKKKPVRQNRPDYRKEVIGRTKGSHHYNRPRKIKGKKWEKIT